MNRGNNKMSNLENKLSLVEAQRLLQVFNNDYDQAK